MRDEADRAATALSDEVRVRLYDQALNLARIGAWACELETERLTWTPGVYDIFGYPMATRCGARASSISISTSRGATWNSLVPR
jgi:PAS domain-containing protein